jgi:hypothetical protein
VRRAVKRSCALFSTGRRLAEGGALRSTEDQHGEAVGAMLGME